MAARSALLFIWMLTLCGALDKPAAAQTVRAAVDRGDIAAVRRAIQARGGVNQADSNGTTPLHVAANKGLADIAKLLIDAGAEVNAHGEAGWTPLHYAVARHQFDVISLLVERGAIMESQTSDGNMPIHIGARDGGEEGVAYALTFGSEVDARNRDGNTPLAVAAWYGRADVARLLIGAGADIHTKNMLGNTPLEEALRGRQSEIANIITMHDQDLKAYESLVQRRAGYWPNVRTSYANWREPRAHTQVVYKSEFSDGTVGTEWFTLPTHGTESARLRVSATPKGGRKFLGDFSSQSVRLKLANLPAHHEMAVTFDLYIMRSWDGSDINSGPDVWSLSVVGGPELLTTTFANTCANRSAVKPLGLYKNLKIQAYPGEYPVGHNPFCAEADEVNALGYQFNLYGKFCDMDAVYKMRYTFPHTEGDAVLNFSAEGLESLDNESWGLNNIEVSVDSIPPPEPKPVVTTPAAHPNTTSVKPKSATPHSTASHPQTRSSRKLASTKHKSTSKGNKSGSAKSTSTTRLHDKKKPLTP